MDPIEITKVSEQPIVYIREIAVAELPAELRAQAGALETIFAIGDEEGKQLALVADRELAFDVARKNGTQPVSVH